MLRTRFGHVRTLLAVAILSFGLLAGIAGTTQPAEARTNIEAFCHNVGGTLVSKQTQYGWSIMCVSDIGLIECYWGLGSFWGTCTVFY